jgi:hypothetical protein
LNRLHIFFQQYISLQLFLKTIHYENCCTTGVLAYFLFKDKSGKLCYIILFFEVNLSTCKFPISARHFWYFAILLQLRRQGMVLKGTVS